MARALESKEVEVLGIKFSSDAMENGESRHRVMRGGYGYILTIMPIGNGAWQNSHYHKGVKEQYTVQEGWIGYAILLSDGTAEFRVYSRGESFTTGGEIHNVYMPGGAVIHTVKFGDTWREKDWFPSPELDRLTKGVSEDYLQKHALRS